MRGREPVLLRLDGDDADVLAAVAGYYHRTLVDEPAGRKTSGRELLERRGLLDDELVATFQLGVSDRSLGLHIPGRQARGGAVIRTRLQQLGVLRSSGHEHLRGRLTVPIRDERGRVVDVYGRLISSAGRVRAPAHAFLHEAPAAPLFHVRVLVEAKQLILCDGVLDALTVWRHGFREVVAVFGAATFDAFRADLLVEHDIERVFVAFRRDADGDHAAEKTAALLRDRGVEVFRVVFPRNMDANDFAQSVEDPHDALLTALRHAEWVGAGEPSHLPWALFGDDAVEVAAPEVIHAETTTIRALALRRREVVERDAGPSKALVPWRATDDAGEPGDPTFDPADTPPADPVVDDDADEVAMQIRDRTWRVRGLAANTAPNSLKVNLLVIGTEGIHVDIVQLYLARQRNAFVRAAAAELMVPVRVIKHDLGQVLLAVEEIHERRVAEAASPKRKVPPMTDAEREEALALLREPDLLDRIVADLDTCGVVGEPTNKKVCYLTAISRLDESPLAAVVRSSSGAGKTMVSDAVLDFVPPESLVRLSAMTNQSLFYLRSDALKHKVLAIAEEEGAKRASFGLKLLQSDGRLSIASTGKDCSGRMTTETYEVEGPVAMMTTTTSIDVDEELLNRCIELTVDEGRDQTRAIHDRQREAQTLDGMVAHHERERLRVLHRNAQRLLEPLAVVNPFAHHLTFVDHATRTRRDHAKYLGIIRAIALLHQHQRAVKTITLRGDPVRYIEVTKRDIEVANQLCDEVLGRSLDELPAHTRKVLTEIAAMMEEVAHAEEIDRAEVRFTRRQLREHTSVGHSQLAVHLQRLVDMEYLLVHHGGAGRQYVYELAWDGGGDDGAPRLNGLIDPSTLADADTTATLRG